MTVYLRNTISKQVFEVSDAEAEGILAHPVHGAVNEIVDSPKPEVLGKPYTLDADGNQVPVNAADEKIDASHDVKFEEDAPPAADDKKDK